MKIERPSKEASLLINMSTRDLFSSEQMSHTKLPQHSSRYPMGVVDRCVETGSENNDFVYEQPPPTPLALSSSPTTIPPKYREIQPRLSGCGINPKTPDDTLLLKPPRCRGGKTRQNRQRRPQGRNREPKPVQLEADANVVSFARTRSERFELPNRLIPPQILRLTQGP